jgi:hypothetical protein
MKQENLSAPSENDNLSSTARQLLREFQLIDQVWKKAEDKLAETHVPIDIRVKIRDGNINANDGHVIGEYVQYLGYNKVKGNRRICWIIEQDFFSGENEDAVYKPITECPVDVRVEMFDWYAKLYAEAEAVAKSYVPKLQEAREKFESKLKWIDL